MIELPCILLYFFKSFEFELSEFYLELSYLIVFKYLFQALSM